MRAEHAFQQLWHGGDMDPPEEHWSYWGCRCGLRYYVPKGGYATRALARRLHREHLAKETP